MEASAQGSAEGQVQDLGYVATFPLLLNIDNQPTYFLTLKDGSGLVKKYALVNVQKYQVVAIGDTLEQCQENYHELMESNHIVNETDQAQEIRGKIEKIASIVQDGNTHYYVMLEGDDRLFDVNVVDNLKILQKDTGDMVTFGFTEGSDACTVSKVE